MERALAARVETYSWVHRFPRGGPALLFLLAAFVTLIGVAALDRAEKVRHRTELENYATQVAADVERRATEQIAALHAASAVFALRGDISRREFTSFASGLKGSGAYQGPLALGWVQRVPVDEIASFQRQEAAAGQPGFQIFPAPVQGQTSAYPIIYVDPWKEVNRKYIGYDLYSDPMLRKAMARSAHMGSPVATARLEVVERSRTATTPGLVIFMPVMRREAQGMALKGFIYSTIEASDLLSRVTEGYRGEDKQISLYDEAKGPSHLLARRNAGNQDGTTIDRKLTIANRQWILSVSMGKPAVLSDLAKATLAFGFILAGLIMLIARLITRRAMEDRAMLDWYTRQLAIRTSLSRELSHRVKNTLANVLSIVALTRRRVSDIDEFAESLTGRVRALSATQDLLSQADWREASIDEIAHAELAPYLDEEAPRVFFEGPDIRLAPNEALSLGLALHELATNAAKYGALSTPDGRIFVHWSLEAPEIAAVAWREEGGPDVRAPTRRGFGVELIEKIVSQELHSKVDLRFLPTGVECLLRVPVRKRTEFTMRSGGALPG